MATPVLVLLIALPMLRPLRHPIDVSDNELSRLATVQSLVEYHTLRINDSQFFQSLRERSGGNPASTIRVGRDYYSDRPPVLAMLLAGAYAILYKLGYTFRNNAALVIYLLTLLGVTIPVAGAGGLVYKMGRLFELPRPKRAALAAVVVFASGLISYSVVLNPHAPAAAMVLAACACLFLVTVAKTPQRNGQWFAISGFCAALAAAIDPSAGIFLAALVLVILSVRIKPSARAGALLLYLLGATPPIFLHLTLTVPVTGDSRPGFLHPELIAGRWGAVVAAPTVSAGTEDESDEHPGWIQYATQPIARVLDALFGSRGILSHFPVVVLGFMGIALVLRRHWPGATKMLAVVTLGGVCVIVGVYVFSRADWSQAMFGPRWFIVFLPLLLFWAGAWLRKTHTPLVWSLAGFLLLFSVLVSLLGMTDPFVPAGGSYTAYTAMRRLFHPIPATQPERPPIVAGGG